MTDRKLPRIKFDDFELLNEQEIEGFVNIHSLHGHLYSRFYDLLDFIKLKIVADENGNLPAGMKYFLQKFEEHSDSILNRYDVKSIVRATRLIDSLIISSLERDTDFSRKLKKFEPALLMFLSETRNFRKMARILDEFGSLSLSQLGLSLELRSRDLLIYFEPKLRKAFNKFDEGEQADFQKLSNNIQMILERSELPQAYRRFLQKLFNISMQVRRINPLKLTRIISDLKNFLNREIVNFELGLSKEELKTIRRFCIDLRLMKERTIFLLKNEQ